MRSKAALFRKSLYIFIWIFSACANSWSINTPADLALDYERGPPLPPLLHLRGNTPPVLNNSSSKIKAHKAVHIVAAAQQASQARNLRLLANPRKNKQEFQVTLSQTPDIDSGTFVNQTVAAAAALVADVVAAARNTSLTRKSLNVARQSSSYWMPQMTQNGQAPFVANSSYKVWRNVQAYGAIGNGIVDDTAAINKAISDGNRCGLNCGSTSTLQAVIYFPPGTYLVSGSIIQYYFTQFVGDAVTPPTILVSPSFVGLGVISTDVYIDGGNNAEWYINQSNFFRQIRNFVIDMRGGPPTIGLAGIHWQVAQATSLHNIKFLMSTASGNDQQGIFMENGSGGFLSDLVFSGGSLGLYAGNQQFTVRGLTFTGQLTRAVEIHWDWGWTWKNIIISNAPIAVIMSTPGSFTEVGSSIFIDSSITNCPIGWQLQARANSSISISLFNIQTTNVPVIVQYKAGATLLAGSGGATTVTAWGVGKRFDTTNGETAGVWQSGNFPRAPTISPSLLQGGTSSQGFFGRSKPQYESLAASSFLNVKLAPYNAKGDGSTDDTVALNSALSAAAAAVKIAWIPAGVYLVTDTILVPVGSKVVGQSWSQIMGFGAKFSNAQAPHTVVKIGNIGDVGIIELQDLLFTVRGATAGAVILEWNVHESSPGSAAMWDCHIRVGGALGSSLQASNCPKLTGSVNSNCVAASLLVRITSKASAYFENTWFWVADHDLDIPSQDQIDIYSGRGVLIESTGPVWLYGTASEHSVLYQYQTVDASNIFMGMIQTESPYYQTSPSAPSPFTSVVSAGLFPSDPDTSYCQPSSPTCALSWGLRIMNSQHIFIYGAGLYSWFQKYSQACVDTENCQDRITYIEDSGDIWFYSLITKASVEMISPNGGVSVLGKDNKINFCDVVMAWLGGAGSASGVIYKSPISATVIPFSHTTVAASATFTVGGPVVTDVDWTPNNGNQNSPVGPGASTCLQCDLIRLITSTCCGTGGSIGNPVVISPSTPIPRDLPLPAGFVPNQQVPDATGKMWPAGQPLPNEVIVPMGTSFPVPFLIPPGMSLTNTDDTGDNVNGTLFLPDDFWSGSHTVSCPYPCTIIFPPIISVTIMTFPPITTAVTSGTITSTTTWIPPVQSSEKIRISSTTVSSDPGSQPTKIIFPLPALKPLCIKFTIPIIGVTITIGLCPPSISPFPPPIPGITIIPVPPGGKAGPTTPDNLPTPDEEEEQEQEEEEDLPETCPWTADEEGPDQMDRGGFGQDFPGMGGTPNNGTFIPVNMQSTVPSTTSTNPPGAGTGSPTTVSVVVTVFAPSVIVTSTESITETRTVTISTSATSTQPTVHSTPNTKAENLRCYQKGVLVVGGTMSWGVDQFCKQFVGHPVSTTKLAQMLLPVGPFWTLSVGVIANNNCEWTFDDNTCRKILMKIADECDAGPFALLRIGGQVTDNCSTWYMHVDWN